MTRADGRRHGAEARLADIGREPCEALRETRACPVTFGHFHTGQMVERRAVQERGRICVPLACRVCLRELPSHGERQHCSAGHHERGHGRGDLKRQHHVHEGNHARHEQIHQVVRSRCDTIDPFSQQLTERRCSSSREVHPRGARDRAMQSRSQRMDDLLAKARLHGRLLSLKQALSGHDRDVQGQHGGQRGCQTHQGKSAPEHINDATEGALPRVHSD